METATPPTPPRTRPAGPVRLLLVLALLVLSPIGAEYLSGYDDSTGNPLALLGGLFVFIPLYGAAAVLIREAARRFGIDWGGVLTMGAAFGIVEAGLIDQAMFSHNYRDIPYWQDLVGPTWIEPLGFGAASSLGWIIGHMVMSITAPIVLAEGLSPRLADRPWLRAPGLIATALLYLAGAWTVLRWHYDTESDHASAGQLIGAAAVALALVVLAFAFGRRKAERVERRIPPLWAIGAAAFAAICTVGLDSTWAGVALIAAALGAVAVGAAYFARSTAWGRRQVAALAVGALLAQAFLGFFTEPLGGVDPVAKYGHNVAATLLVLALGAWALRRTR
ncbi:hypothetical protein [Glycomyces harbinensis]|uniref:Uncharacterized protein n=1 Tax=Glycomyces harbinensis TaxID=58114 RepID=A0A1G7BYD2_9ACTN|nr:hypothetical protein [Glycomyces harbinensis]SDE31426.1 hypothetical protein SAMN05216270_11816 [Glycomyces harbinensis]